MSRIRLSGRHNRHESVHLAGILQFFGLLIFMMIWQGENKVRRALAASLAAAAASAAADN